MVFCCIGIVGIAVLYFILLWLRQIFSWPRRDSSSRLRSPPRGMTGHGALPVYGHTYLFTARAGDTALLFTKPTQRGQDRREYSCLPAFCLSNAWNRPLGDCFCLFIWGQWRVAVMGPQRAQLVMNTTPLRESWPWNPPVNLLGKSCLAFVNDDKEREHLRMLIARPLCHSQILLYAPLFAQRAEWCLQQIQAGKFRKKKNNEKRQTHVHQDRNSHSHRVHDEEDAEEDDDEEEEEDDETFAAGPEGEVYFKVKWEALRSYTFDLVDGPILNTQKWNEHEHGHEHEHEYNNNNNSPQQPDEECGASTAQQQSVAAAVVQVPLSSPMRPLQKPLQDSAASTGTASSSRRKKQRVPSRDTMLLYMERMKRGIDVIKTTFGPEWMYIWILNEYGRALNARQHIDKVVVKHVQRLSEAEQKVKHAVGHAFTDPATQPIPLLTIRENLLRTQEGIMGVNNNLPVTSNLRRRRAEKVIKPQFSARPRARSAPDYSSTMAHEIMLSLQHGHHDDDIVDDDDDGAIHYGDEQHGNGSSGNLRPYHSTDDNFYNSLHPQPYDNKNSTPRQLLPVMDEMEPLQPPEAKKKANNDNGTNSTPTTAISASNKNAAVPPPPPPPPPPPAMVDDYVEPHTTEQDLARPRYETSPARASWKRTMQKQLAELESAESITARQFHDEMDRPRILRHEQEEAHAHPQQVFGHDNRNDKNNSSTNNGDPSSSAAQRPKPQPRPPPPPRPVMSVLERLMKQHDNAGNGLSQIVMAEISVLLWMMMDVGNAWTAMALHLLAADREACYLVQEELDALAMDFCSSSPGGDHVGAADYHSLLFTPSVLSRMKYLDALLYEAIRLCPENLGGMKKTTQTVELQDAGVQIPKDTNIFFCQPTDMVFDIHKALGKKPESLGRQYPSVELYGFLPLHGLEVPLMVLQSKVFLVTLLQKFSPFCSKKRTFLRRITTKLNQSIHNIKQHHQHRRTASGGDVPSTATTSALIPQNKSISSGEEDGAASKESNAHGDDTAGDAALNDDTCMAIDVELYSNSKECISRDQGIEGMLEMQIPKSGSTAESTKGGGDGEGEGEGEGDDQRQPQSLNSSSWSGDDVEEGGGGQRNPHHHHHHNHHKSKPVTPSDAAELFNKIPFPEPRRVILLRPRATD